MNKNKIYSIFILLVVTGLVAFFCWGVAMNMIVLQQISKPVSIALSTMLFLALNYIFLKAIKVIK